MREPTFLIRTALAAEPTHGYGELTESGAAALTSQVQRLRRNADAAAARLRPAFGGAL
ncbi:hypothetical protein [Paractinoplanes durhamensis]|nr:hypothetical protein [Actinoplanes durhamensis]